MKSKVLIGLMLIIIQVLSAKLKQDIQKPDSLFLGSRIALNLSANQDLEDIVLPDTLTKFAILSIEKSVVRGRPIGLKLIIVPLDTGTHTFPALKVNLAKPSVGVLDSKPVTLLIKEIRAPKDTTLVDIANTEKLKGELPYWTYFLIGGIALLSIIAAIFLYLRKHRKKKVTMVQPEPILADKRTHREKALDALYDLKQQNLPDRGEIIMFHFCLSEIMKLYLEGEFGFSANEMTTREIRQQLRKENYVSITEQREIIEWLESCDKVKFAKHNPSLPECAEKIDWIWKWLLNQPSEPILPEQENRRDA